MKAIMKKEYNINGQLRQVGEEVEVSGLKYERLKNQGVLDEKKEAKIKADAKKSDAKVKEIKAE